LSFWRRIRLSALTFASPQALRFWSRRIRISIRFAFTLVCCCSCTCFLSGLLFVLVMTSLCVALSLPRGRRLLLSLTVLIPIAAQGRNRADPNPTPKPHHPAHRRAHHSITRTAHTRRSWLTCPTRAASIHVAAAPGRLFVTPTLVEPPPRPTLPRDSDPLPHAHAHAPACACSGGRSGIRHSIAAGRRSHGRHTV
jgi:hypothetical protein